MRARLGWWLRCLADRIDPDHAFRRTHMGLTLELHAGWVLHEDKGLPVWYYGPDYDKAYDDAERPPVQIDWRTMTTKRRRHGA